MTVNQKMFNEDRSISGDIIVNYFSRRFYNTCCHHEDHCVDNREIINTQTDQLIN